MMRRVGFTMRIQPGKIEEYKKRHQNIWPELSALLKKAGISEYSIFLDEENHLLFGFQKVDGEKGSQELQDHPVVQKWWKFMSDVSVTNEDLSPTTRFLEEVFYLP